MELIEKGYKKTEVGLIPEDWELAKLNDLSEKIMVGIASAATHAYRDKGVLMFRNQNIKSNFLDDTDVLHITEEYESVFKGKRLRTGDLLTARTGYPGTTCVVPAKYEGSQSFTTLITRPRQDFILSEFLCSYINSEIGLKFFEKNQIGGGQKNVNAGALKHMPIPVPTLNEQKAIAIALSDVDELINNLEKLIAKKKAIKQGAMQQLLKGKIRLKGFESDGFQDSIYGKIPTDWKIEKIGYVSEIFGRIGFRGYTVNDIVNEGKGALSLSPSNIVADKIDFKKGTFISWAKYYESPEIIIKKGDIVLVKTASVGKTAIIKDLPYKITLNPQLVVLKKIKVDNYYLGYMMSFKIIQNQIVTSVAGGVVPTLTQEQIASFSFPVPKSLEEQKAISNAIFDMDDEINCLEMKRQKCINIKQGMMQELLTGKTRLV